MSSGFPSKVAQDRGDEKRRQMQTVHCFSFLYLLSTYSARLCAPCDLTKYDAFRMNRDQAVWTLKYASKSIQTSLILRQRSPKSYKLLKFLWFPWYSLKWTNIVIFIVGAWRDFTVVTKPMKNFKSFYSLRGACMDFEPYFCRLLSNVIDYRLTTTG